MKTPSVRFIGRCYGLDRSREAVILEAVLFCRKYGDYLYDEQKYKEAMVQYIHTIG